MATALETMSQGQNPRTGLQGEIEELLRAFRGLDPIKKLFWELLGYNPRDDAVSIAGLGADLRSCLIEARLFASHDRFHLYYLTMTGESLTRPIFRRISRSFRGKHRFLALLVGNSSQTEWHLAYQPDDLNSAGSPGHVATISLGHNEENLRRQAQALSKLKTYDEDDEPLSLLEITAAYEDVFAKARPHPKAIARAKDGVELLLAEIGRHQLLTSRQERAMLVELAKISELLPVSEGERVKVCRVPDGNWCERYQELRDKLVVHNLRLCFSIAKKYAKDFEEIPDLFQEATVGLLKAIDLFDQRKNVRLSTFAYRLIQQSVVRWIRKHRYLIRPKYCSDSVPKGKRGEIGLLSLSDPENSQSTELVDPSTCSPSSDREELERNLILGLTMKSLPEREANVLIHRFGLYGIQRKTLEKIAETMGVTKERVRQIESRALDRLRGHLKWA